MSFETWSEYDSRTGLLTGRTLQAFHDGDNSAFLKANLASGYSAVSGLHDHNNMRVDIANEVRDEHGNLLTHGPVIEYQPARPSVDHEWNAATKRWELNATAQQRQQRQASARAQIAALELSQARPHRELTLNPSDAEARKRLESIETQIVTLRKDL